ncbi:MAG TPA: ABC transporter permease [Blastocatellia bacterium]|nr:ABC transporter permease [Blastocatellia bacterium]
MENLLHDLRYSFRMLRKSPGFTAVATLTLALGIGANTAIFSVVNALLLKPLPFKDPDRLVRIWGKFETEGIPKNWISEPELLDLNQMTESFEDIAAYQGGGVNLTGQQDPVRVNAAFVNASLFPVLGINAKLGRTFSQDEDQPGSNRVALLSYSLWQSRFGSQPDIVGESVGINGENYSVIGVMPDGFRFPDKDDIWIPLAIDKAKPDDRGSHGLEVVAKIKPGVTPEQAGVELSNIAATLQERYPSNYPQDGGWGLFFVPMLDELVGKLRPALWVLLGAVAFVLLIACVNVANLLLARAGAREKEFAVRAALGAGRGRLVRQLITESLLLALIGSALGLALAWTCVRAFVAFGPSDIPRLDEVGLDWRVAGFTLFASILTGLVFGLAPALQASKPDLQDALKEGGRGSTGGRHRLRNVLVISEVAFALVLLVGAGLMIRSFGRLLDLNLGFSTERILTMRLSLPRTKYKEDPQQAALYRSLLERVRALPGVASASVISELPLSGSYSSGSTAVERPDVDEGLRKFKGIPYIEADRRTVSADYFSTMEIALKEGRLFTEADTETAPPVAVVDEMFERRFWPNGSAVGKRFVAQFDNANNIKWGEIVGVVAHVSHYGIDQVKEYGLGQEGREQVYYPYLQNPNRYMYLAVKTRMDPLSLSTAVRGEVLALDPDQPVYDVKSMEQLASSALGERRLNMLLLVGFAVIALVLAAVGIYGVMSYSVVQRTHELGIRMALGARTSNVLSLVVRQGMTLALIGVAAGLAGAFTLTRLMTSLLYGVSTTDPLTFAAFSVILTGVALIACLVPARRATTVDPMIALRCE